MGLDILQLPDCSEYEVVSSAPAETPPAGARQVQVLLWEHVKGLLKEAEQEEVKNALGRGAIEENEQLVVEATSLEEILADLHQRTERQTEVQRLFETPARSMIEDEIRLLLETLHVASDNATAPGPEGPLSQDADQDDQHSSGDDEDKESSSESFYDVLLKQKNSRESKDGQAERMALRRDCHSAPIPAQSPKDKQIFEYLVTRPSTSGSLRPRSSNGFRPGTAYLPQSASPNDLIPPLPRPQSAAVTWGLKGGSRTNRLPFLEGCRLESPNSATPDRLIPENGALRNSLDPISWEAVGTRNSFVRPSSSRSSLSSISFDKSGWDLPSRPGTQQGRVSEGASRPSTASSASAQRLSHVVDAVADRLSVFQIDVVAGPLKQALADERAALLEDIEYLHQLINMEADLSYQASRPPPSIKDLKDYSARLEASFRQHIRERDLKQNGTTRAQQSTETNATGNGVGSGAISQSSREGLSKSPHRLEVSLNGSKRIPEASGKRLYKGDQLSGELHRKGSEGSSIQEAQLENPNGWTRQETEEYDAPGIRKSSSSKVQRLRSLIQDSQTEASGATSLCRAHLT